MRQRGSASIEFVWFTVVLLVPLVYVVVTVFETQRASFGVAAASRAAARAFVTTADPAAAQPRAEAAAAVVLADHDVEGARVTVTCQPVTCRIPGAIVTVEVRADKALPLAPRVFGDSIGSIAVIGVHSEPWGRYRADR